MRNLSMVKDSPPLVLEDRVAREVRHLSAAREKKEKDAAKMRRDMKAGERGALLKRHRQQWLEGLPEEESPSKTALEEESDDSDNNDAGSRYDIATFLVHLPDVRSLQGPIGGGSTSQASRAASGPVEGKEEQAEGRALEGPSKKRSAEPEVLPVTSSTPRMRARSPRTSSAGGEAPSTPETRAPSIGIRSQGQTALMM
jgi:hypothetical protein